MSEAQKLYLENLEGKNEHIETTPPSNVNIDNESLESIYDIPVQVSVVLGKSEIQVKQILKLARGTVIELDRKVEEPVDIYVNDRLVAHGEITVVDGRLGVTITEITKLDKRVT